MYRALALALVTSLTFGAEPSTSAPHAQEEALREGALCQLSFEGSLMQEGPTWVSISVTHLVEGEDVETRLEGQFRKHTGIRYIAALLAARLEAAGARIVQSDHAQAPESADLFIEDVVSVRLELPLSYGSFGTSVTFCDRPLGVLGLRPTSAKPGTGKLEFFGLLRSVDGKSRGEEHLEVLIREGDSGHTICKRLFEDAAGSGWLPNRPRTDRWSPGKRQDARKLESSEIQFNAHGWELELIAG